MKTLARLLIFFLCFTIEVHVHAHSKKSSSVAKMVEIPNHCLKTKKECLVQPEKDSIGRIENDKANVFLTSKSLVLIKKNGNIRLIRGSAVVEAKKIQIVETKYGSIDVSAGHAATVDIDYSKVIVTSLSGKSSILPLGRESKFELPAAYTVWLGGVFVTGNPSLSRLMPADMDAVVRSLGSSIADLDHVRSMLSDFKPSWSEAVETQGQRDLASIFELQEQDKQDKLRQAERQKALAIENQNLHDLFFNKTFNQ